MTYSNMEQEKSNNKNQTQEKLLDLIKRYPVKFRLIKSPTKEIILAGVSSYGYNIRYVSFQKIETFLDFEEIENICLQAVKKTGRAIQHIPEKYLSLKVKIAAIICNPYSIQFIKNYDLNLAKFAVSINYLVKKYIKEEYQNLITPNKIYEKTDIQCGIMNTPIPENVKYYRCNFDKTHIFRKIDFERWIESKIEPKCIFCFNKINMMNVYVNAEKNNN